MLQIDALFGSGRVLAEIVEDVARLGARLLIQTAMEVEVDEFLGRVRYQRRAGVQDARPGSRNGFCPTTVKTTTGAVTVSRPKLRGTHDREGPIKSLFIDFFGFAQRTSQESNSRRSHSRPSLSRK